jgi:septal ring factor EnvC (AmiA/AmiB activator)
MLCILKVIKKFWLTYYLKNVTNHQLSDLCWHYCEILIVKKKKRIFSPKEKETQNTVEGHSSRLEKVKDRISELENKVHIKEKTEEQLVKQFQTCERNMQELSNSIKRPNLRLMGIEEGEEVQAKGIHNIFNKTITENFPNLNKVLPIQVQEASRTPKRIDQNRTSA